MGFNIGVLIFCHVVDMLNLTSLAFQVRRTSVNRIRISVMRNSAVSVFREKKVFNFFFLTFGWKLWVI